MRVLLLLAIVIAFSVGPVFGATLSTDKGLYKVGEQIRVEFSDPAGSTGAWIGLFYASTPTDQWTNADDFDLAYQYTSGKTSGMVLFEARDTGFFQFRFFTEDAAVDVPIASSSTFEVSSEGGRIGEPSLAFEKPVYMRGERIRLSFTFNPALPGGAWIGLFKNTAPLDGSENPDNFDIGYDYINNRTSGVWAFDAPKEPGYYVAAIISGDSNEWTPYCKVRMQVTLDGVKALPVAHSKQPLALSAFQVRAGDEITAAYAIPEGLERPWVGLIPASVTSLKESDNDAKDVAWIYADSGVSWYWTFHAPSEPGRYVIRIFPADNDLCYAITEGVYFDVIPR